MSFTFVTARTGSFREKYFLKDLIPDMIGEVLLPRKGLRTEGTLMWSLSGV